jgi:hypothetical protein
MGNVLVVMTGGVSDARNLFPRDQRVPLLDRIGQPTARFGDNLDAALDDPLFPPIGLESGKTNPSHLASKQIDGLEDIKKANER